MRLLFKSDVIDHPIVQGTVIFKLDGTERMGDPLRRILNRVGEVIKRINAPFVPLSVMCGMHDAVDGRVTQIDVRGRHVDLRTQGLCTVGKFAVFHTLEKREVLFYRAIAIRTVLPRLGQSAAVFAHLVGTQIADIRFSVLDQFDGVFVALVEIIGAVENAARRLATEPKQIFVDALDVFVIFFCGVGVVITKVKKAAVFFCRHGIDPDRLRRSDMEIPVRLGRKAGMHFQIGVLFQIFVDDVKDKIIFQFFHLRNLLRLKLCGEMPRGKRSAVSRVKHPDVCPARKSSDGKKQGGKVPSREIAPTVPAAVEEKISRECGVADPIGNAPRCVPGRRHHFYPKGRKAKDLPVLHGVIRSRVPALFSRKKTIRIFPGIGKGVGVLFSDINRCTRLSDPFVDPEHMVKMRMG